MHVALYLPSLHAINKVVSQGYNEACICQPQKAKSKAVAIRRKQTDILINYGINQIS